MHIADCKRKVQLNILANGEPDPGTIQRRKSIPRNRDRVHAHRDRGCGEGPTLGGDELAFAARLIVADEHFGPCHSRAGGVHHITGDGAPHHLGDSPGRRH